MEGAGGTRPGNRAIRRRATWGPRSAAAVGMLAFGYLATVLLIFGTYWPSLMLLLPVAVVGTAALLFRRRGRPGAGQAGSGAADGRGR